LKAARVRGEGARRRRGVAKDDLMAAEERALADEKGLGVDETVGGEVAQRCLHEPEGLRERKRKDGRSAAIELERFLPVSFSFDSSATKHLCSYCPYIYLS
jgi:hypothetical protein